MAFFTPFLTHSGSVSRMSTIFRSTVWEGWSQFVIHMNVFGYLRVDTTKAVMFQEAGFQCAFCWIILYYDYLPGWMNLLSNNSIVLQGLKHDSFVHLQHAMHTSGWNCLWLTAAWKDRIEGAEMMIFCLYRLSHFWGQIPGYFWTWRDKIQNLQVLLGTLDIDHLR